MSIGSETAVAFEGHEGALTLIFHERPEVPTGVSCPIVRITFGRLQAEITTLVDADVRRLRGELGAVLASSTISGVTRFGSVDSDLHVRIELDHGKGLVLAEVETDFGDQNGSAVFKLTTDQAALQNTLRQIDDVLRAFPAL
jgi:hypothetical protein